MIRLINNWVITMIETVLLVAFAVLMLVFGDQLNVLFGIALMVYTLVFVLSKVISYRGMIQLITIIEFFAITTLAIFVIAKVDILPDNNIVNTSIGVAMWFRATTEILHSYLGQGEGRAAKRNFNAWKIFLYILLLTLGTFIATTDIVDDSILQYFVIGVAVAAAIIMGVLTYTNYVDYRIRHPKPVKAEVSQQNVIESSNGTQDVLEQNDAPAQLNAPEQVSEPEQVNQTEQIIELPLPVVEQTEINEPVEVIVEPDGASDGAVAAVEEKPKRNRKKPTNQ